MSDRCLHCNAQVRGQQVQARRCFNCGKLWRQRPPPPSKKVASKPPPKPDPRRTPTEPAPPIKKKKNVSLERLLRDRGTPFGPDSYPLKRVLVELAAEFEIELPKKATKADIWQILDGFKYEQ